MRKLPLLLALAVAAGGPMTFISSAQATETACQGGGFHSNPAGGNSYWKHCTDDGSVIRVEAFYFSGQPAGKYCIAPNETKFFPTGVTRAKLVGLC